MKTNYLLIDYENVQPKNFSVLNGQPFKVIVFLGANQAKLPTELVCTLQELGIDVKYVRISGNGSNALDFHIAFTLGELSKSDPDAYFHIISKDTGFDPLIEYLRKNGIFAQRSREIGDIPILKISNAKTVQEKMETIVRNLESRGSGRPRRVKTLANMINALFSKSLEDAELMSLVQVLEKGGHISIEGSNVSYHFSSAS